MVYRSRRQSWSVLEMRAEGEEKKMLVDEFRTVTRSRCEEVFYDLAAV